MLESPGPPVLRTIGSGAGFWAALRNRATAISISGLRGGRDVLGTVT